LPDNEVEPSEEQSSESGRVNAIDGDKLELRDDVMVGSAFRTVLARQEDPRSSTVLALHNDGSPCFGTAARTSSASVTLGEPAGRSHRHRHGAAAGLGVPRPSPGRSGAAVVVNDVTDAGRWWTRSRLPGKALAVTGDVSSAPRGRPHRRRVEHFAGSTSWSTTPASCGQDALRDVRRRLDLVLKVHLRGHFLLSPARRALAGRAKADGPVYGRWSTRLPSVPDRLAGQPNYAPPRRASRADRFDGPRPRAYGVRANAICRARDAMTEDVFGDAPAEGVDPLSVDHVAPFVVFLASPAEEISGQVFVVHGGMVALLRPPTVEQRFDTVNGQWTAEELEAGVGAYFAGRDPHACSPARRSFPCLRES